MAISSASGVARPQTERRAGCGRRCLVHGAGWRCYDRARGASVRGGTRSCPRIRARHICAESGRSGTRQGSTRELVGTCPRQGVLQADASDSIEPRRSRLPSHRRKDYLRASASLASAGSASVSPWEQSLGVDPRTTHACRGAPGRSYAVSSMGSGRYPRESRKAHNA